MRKKVTLALIPILLIVFFLVIKRLEDTIKIGYFIIWDSVFYSINRGLKLIEKAVGLISLQLSAFLSGKQSFLLMGFIFGQQENITENFYHNLKITGLLHLVVASGSNVSMMIGLAQISMSRFRTNRIGYYLVTLVVIWTYCNLLNFSPPILRATTMATFMIIAQLFAKQYQPIWFLFISFFLLAIINFSLLTNLSFQLSILSSLGIMVGLSSLQTFEVSFLNLLENGFVYAKERTSNWLIAILSDSFLTTVAAQMFSLPIILITFHQFSWISILANTFLLGLTPLINLTAIIMIFCLFFRSFSQVPLLLSMFSFFVVTQVFIKSIDFFSSLTSGLTEVKFTRVHFFLWWGFLLIFFVGKYLISRRIKTNFTRYE